MQALNLNGVDSTFNPPVDEESGRDSRLDDLVAILGENMPHDQNSVYYSYLSSFMSLRLMLLKPSPSKEEVEQQSTLLSSYTSYLSSGRTKSDIAVMIARDYMFLRRQNSMQPSPQHQSISQNHSGQYQSIDLLSLTSHPNSLMGNNMAHHVSFMSHPGNQMHNGLLQQQFSSSSSLRQQNQQRSTQQQINPIDASNHSHISLPTSMPRKTDP